MKNIIQKLTSRKFWMAVAGVATGVAMALGANTTDISAVAGGVVAVISCATFIVVEGKIDAERIKNAIEGVQEGLEIMEGNE